MVLCGRVVLCCVEVLCCGRVVLTCCVVLRKRVVLCCVAWRGVTLLVVARYDAVIRREWAFPVRFDKTWVFLPK